MVGGEYLKSRKSFEKISQNILIDKMKNLTSYSSVTRIIHTNQKPLHNQWSKLKLVTFIDYYVYSFLPKVVSVTSLKIENNNLPNEELI